MAKGRAGVMTLQQFTILRRDELLSFFKARYGRSWQRLVTRQTNMNPRSFHRWKSAAPLSICRQIQKVEAFARTIGFESATDAEVQARLLQYEQFKQAAAEAIERGKQKEIERALEEEQSREIKRCIDEGFRRARETSACHPTE